MRRLEERELKRHFEKQSMNANIVYHILKFCKNLEKNKLYYYMVTSYSNKKAHLWFPKKIQHPLHLSKCMPSFILKKHMIMDMSNEYNNICVLIIL